MNKNVYREPALRFLALTHTRFFRKRMHDVRLRNILLVTHPPMEKKKLTFLTYGANASITVINTKDGVSSK